MTHQPFVSGLRFGSPRMSRRMVTANAATTPLWIDHRACLPEASDQGQSSKCAAYAMAGALEYERWRQLGIMHQIDPDPIYDRAKQVDGDTNDGTTLESVVQAAVDLGMCEVRLPLDVCTDMAQFWRLCHKRGVVLAGFMIDENWYNTAADGWIPNKAASVLGGHAVLLHGFNRNDKSIHGQNSWSSQRGWRGHFRLTETMFNQQFMYGLGLDIKVQR